MNITIERKGKIYFVISLLLWIASYCFLMYSGLVARHYMSASSSFLNIFESGIILFIIPSIFLVLSLYWGQKSSKKHILFFIVMSVFGFLLYSPVKQFIYAITYRGEGVGGAFLLMGYASYEIQYFLIQVAFALTVFVLHKVFKSWGFTKVLIGSFVFYLVLVSLFLGNTAQKEVSFDKRFCSDEEKAKGFYSRVFFLKPLNKTELRKIVEENNFTIRFLELAPSNDPHNFYTLGFNPHFKGVYTKENFNKPFDIILTRVAKGREGMNEEFPEDKPFFDMLQKAYDNNESVVWFVDFEGAPTKQLVKVVSELDKEKRLGIYETKDLYYSAGYDPAKIIPQTFDRKIDQARCYKYL